MRKIKMGTQKICLSPAISEMWRQIMKKSRIWANKYVAERVVRS